MFKSYWFIGINHSVVEHSKLIMTVMELGQTDRVWRLLFSIGNFGFYKKGEIAYTII